MVLFRFMSVEEYEALLDGQTVVNQIRHRDRGLWSSAVGFCFGQYPQGVEPERNSDPLFQGVLKDCLLKDKSLKSSILCIFRADARRLHKALGCYSTAVIWGDDPWGLDDSPEPLREYCTTQYSLKAFDLLETYICFWNKKDQEFTYRRIY